MKACGGKMLAHLCSSPIRSIEDFSEQLNRTYQMRNPRKDLRPTYNRSTKHLPQAQLYYYITSLKHNFREKYRSRKQSAKRTQQVNATRKQLRYAFK